MEIELTQGKYAIIDKKDFKVIKGHKWFAIKFRHTYYAATKINKKRVLMHKLLTKVSGKDVDHKNRNGLDNRQSNMRPATRSQNCANAIGKGGRSKFKGIYWFERQKRWAARITVNYKRYFLGYHLTEKDAAKAYDKAALKYFKQFARLNFGGNLG